VAGSEQIFLAISKAATSGTAAHKIVKFNGSIQHKPITLLVDSGSSSSFVSSSLAAHLSGVVSLSSDIKVQVAGGGVLISSQFISQALWFIGDIAFQSDLRVLPLSSYDMIIGMDWLEQHSPMRVH
jgi:predicted aspartyl protease